MSLELETSTIHSASLMATTTTHGPIVTSSMATAKDVTAGHRTGGNLED